MVCFAVVSLSVSLACESSVYVTPTSLFPRCSPVIMFRIKLSARSMMTREAQHDIPMTSGSAIQVVDIEEPTAIGTSTRLQCNIATIL